VTGMNSSFPVGIIGAGPVGLAAAARLAIAGEPFVILEAGDSVAASVRSWAHVRVFSPWKYNMDEAAVSLLSASGTWTAPDPDGYPTGAELADEYLAPLAALPAISDHLRLDAEVVAVTRSGFDKLKTEGRSDAPFAIVTRDGAGHRESLRVRAVIDASGTYRSPNPLGANGASAIGEADAAHAIFYGIPDVLGRDRSRYEGKRVLVVGSGHSAFNALLDLAELASRGTSIIWAMRASRLGDQFGGGDADQLPARGELGIRLRRAVEAGVIAVELGFRASEVREDGDGIVVASDERALSPVDEVIVATGFRPNLTITSELRLRLDEVVESPIALAPLIDPNLHSCGTVPPHGAEQLAHPEANYYSVGMKSYGRAPTFLMMTGYEQVRSVVAWLTGDIEGAREVRLVLPETGVCSGPAGDDSAASCCGGPAPAAVDACCLQDADAKAAGEDGCGCATAPRYEDELELVVVGSAAGGGKCC
jgi:thioredoxin reductase